MKRFRPRNIPASVAVALALSAIAAPSYSAIVSTGDNLHFAVAPTSMVVGSTGVGAFTVNGGTVLDQTNASFGASSVVQIGANPLANGTGIVTGAGSAWIVGAAPNAPTGDFDVGSAGEGRLTVDQGATVIGNQLFVGSNNSGRGTMTIDGVGSRGQFGQATTVGLFGTGALNITGGALLTTGTLLAGQTQGSSTGNITINGMGSTIQATLNTIIGDAGIGRLNVTQGGALNGLALLVGNGTSGNGVVNIDGAGSTIQTTGLSLIGPNGTGSLLITNGGQFVSTFVSANQSALILGSNSGGNGTVTVTGAGSKIAGRGIITLGLNPGPNTVGNLNILNGGVVEEVSLQGAFSAGSTANIQVSGAGSLLRLSSFANQQTFLNIGRVGSGRLDVTAGGKVLMDPTAANATLSSVNVFNVGGSGNNAPAAAVNSNGTVNVSGAGSEIRLKGDFSLISVGRNGTGVLNITNGGQVINENLTGGTFSSIGRATGANGTVLVSGAGSLWQAGNKLFIGTEVTANATGGSEAPGGGTGVLTVSNGGKVIAGSDIIIGAGGTLQGGGGTVQGNVINKGVIAPGNSPGIMTVVGNLALTASGTLNVELGGTSNANPASPEYDQLIVLDNPDTVAQEGLVTVDGKLNVGFANGFNPHAGDFFDILSGFDITQLNPDYFLPTLDAGLRWDISEFTTRGGEILRLTVVGTAVVAEPGMFALLGIGLVGFAALRRRKR